MINPGKNCPIPYTVEQLGEADIKVLRRCMPVAMRGVNFLSGGQSLENAAARLNAINQLKGNSPWNLSFSWSQALQLPLLDICRSNPVGSPLPIEEMTALLQKELVIAGAAASGTYVPQKGQGDHVPPKKNNDVPVAAFA